ncbi:MAG TPA: CAP domain-containing protein [Anaerolineales bacterium]|nr:CAP domain-containing protein [Anaerolineales bacterium]
MIVKTRIFSSITAVRLILFLSFYPTIQARSAPPTPPPESIGDPVLTQDAPHLPEFTACGGRIAPVVNIEYENEVILLVNNERVSRNLPPLKVVSGLTEAARYHATDLGQDDYFEHDSFDRLNGNLTYVCSTWSRIDSFYSGGRAENIAAGYSTPDSVMAAWMNSAGHRSNILSTNNWEIGVGYYQGSGYYYRYWVQDFGKRTGVYPLIINNESSETDDRNVTLYTYGTNWTEMRFKNNNEGWSSWRPFSNYSNWQLPNYSGTHTVYSELRYGTVVVSNSDTISLVLPDQTPELGNLPERVTFNYNLYERSFSPSRATIAPQNIGNGQVLTWVISKQGNWFTVSPDHGTTPEVFVVTPNITPQSQGQVYTGSLTVTVTSPQGVTGSPHTINLELNVSDIPMYKTYLPFSIATHQ